MRSDTNLLVLDLSTMDPAEHSRSYLEDIERHQRAASGDPFIVEVCCPRDRGHSDATGAHECGHVLTIEIHAPRGEPLRLTEDLPSECVRSGELYSVEQLRELGARAIIAAREVIERVKAWQKEPTAKGLERATLRDVQRRIASVVPNARAATPREQRTFSRAAGRAAQRAES